MRIPSRQAGLSLLLAAACGIGSPAQDRTGEVPPVRFILMIADGAGVAHWPGVLSNAAVGQGLLARAAGDRAVDAGESGRSD